MGDSKFNNPNSSRGDNLHKLVDGGSQTLTAESGNFMPYFCSDVNHRHALTLHLRYDSRLSLSKACSGICVPQVVYISIFNNDDPLCTPSPAPQLTTKFDPRSPREKRGASYAWEERCCVNQHDSAGTFKWHNLQKMSVRVDYIVYCFSSTSMLRSAEQSVSLVFITSSAERVVLSVQASREQWHEEDRWKCVLV